MRLKAIHFVPAIVWFIIANILFLMPGPDVPSIGFLDEIYFDKWVHAGLFCGLTCLIAFPFVKAGFFSKRLLIIISISCALYGVLIEFLQKYVAFERDFDVFDMVADTTGCVIGYIAASWLRRRITEKNKPL